MSAERETDAEHVRAENDEEELPNGNWQSGERCQNDKNTKKDKYAWTRHTSEYIRASP